jgi:hypothetical protein
MFSPLPSSTRQCAVRIDADDVYRSFALDDATVADRIDIL